MDIRRTGNGNKKVNSLYSISKFDVNFTNVDVHAVHA